MVDKKEISRTSKDEEKIRLSRIKWEKILSRRLAGFAEVIDDGDVFERYFGEKYLEKMSDKSKLLSHQILKLLALYAVVIVALLVSQNVAKADIEFFGVKFNDFSYYKELLLFFASVLLLFLTVLSVYQNYVDGLIKECLKKFVPDEDARSFYSHLYVDEYFDGFNLGDSKNAPFLFHHFTAVVMIMFLLMLLFLILTLLSVSFFIQIFVVYDVVIKPASVWYVNYFVVVFSVVSILSFWLVLILSLPMPWVDLGYYSEMDKIKQSDPEKYREIMLRSAKDKTKRKDLISGFVSVFIYILVFSSVAFIWHIHALDDINLFLGKAVPGVFFVLIITWLFIDLVEGVGYKWFFKKYPEGADGRLRAFDTLKKVYSIIRIMIPFLLSLKYAFDVLLYVQ